MRYELDFPLKTYKVTNLAGRTVEVKAPSLNLAYKTARVKFFKDDKTLKILGPKMKEPKTVGANWSVKIDRTALEEIELNVDAGVYK